ncbi:MAG: pilus assembly protein N-terminal domain-containing protein, partial [Planctomycetia bacterium]
MQGNLQQPANYGNTYQAPSTQYQRQPARYQPPTVATYQMQPAPYRQPGTYVPAKYRIAQLPDANTPNNSDGPNIIGPATPQPSTNAIPKAFQPKLSQPAVVRPTETAPVPVANPNPAVPFNPNREIIRKLQNASEKMEMVVNTSRIVTLDQTIPQAQVNNPEVLTLTPLSPKQIQMSAKKPGVTQVNIWSNDGKIYSIDVLVVGDAQELRGVLQRQFPSSSLQVVPVGIGGEGSGSVYISGYVDRPEDITQVTQIAEQYYPKVINNVTVSGVQQVLLHAKVMEVSRTKLRTLGIDWAQISGYNLIASSASGLLGGVAAASVDYDPTTGWVTSSPPMVTTSGDPTLQFNVVDGDNALFGILEALREDQLAKVLAEPTLVTINGQPASFIVGGEVPVPVPQSLGTISIDYKKYGTQLNFVPLVLGNGRIRMEVKPRVSELDRSTALFLDGFYVYGFRSREVKTSVEMNAGQTLAIAGLINERTESERRGVPWVSDVPVLGALFRRTTEKNNEIEMLVFVTPELVEAMDPEEVPAGGPGLNSCSPNDFKLHLKGHIEAECCDNGCGLCGSCNRCSYNGPQGCQGMVTYPTGTGQPMMPTRAEP